MAFFERNGVIWTIVIIGVLFCGICLGLLIEGKGHFLPTLTGFATAFGTLLLGVAAIKGVNQWKSEIRGRTEFEAAKNYLRAAYHLRKELNYCRSPMISAQEFPDGYNPLEANASERSSAHAHVYANRWADVANAFVDLEAASIEAEVLWGKPVIPLTAAIKKCVTRLRASMQASLRNIASGGRSFQTNPEFGERIEQDITYAGDEDDNELESLLTDAISAIEEFTKQHLPS